MSKQQVPPYQLGAVRLRLLHEADLPNTLKWRNQDHIRRWFFNSNILSAEQHGAWFRQYQERDDDFVFIIEEVDQGYRPVGQVALYHVDWENRRAEYGRLMIGEADAAGKGLARAATQAILKIGFEVLGLKEIYLEVFPENSRAIKLYEAVGFQEVGRTEQAVQMIIGSSSFTKTLPVS